MRLWTVIKKSHDLPSANWRTRKANDVVQSESEEAQEPGVPIFKGKIKCMFQFNREKFYSSSTFLFYSGPQHIG